MSKILVVDDDESVRRMLSLQLEAQGYDVALAFDSTSTMRAAREEALDLILLDLGLPAGDGFLLMEELKADTHTASIPVIVLTGWDAEGNQEKAYETGAADFFQKPFNPAWLLRAIEGALAERSEKKSESAISS